MMIDIKKTAGAANVQCVINENLKDELFDQCPDITNREELEAYANKVGMWALETAKTNLPTLDTADYDDEFGISMDEVVPADDLLDMLFTINGRTFSAYNIFQYICPGFLVDDVDDITEEDIEYEVSKGVFCFVDEENPF